MRKLIDVLVFVLVVVVVVLAFVVQRDHHYITKTSQADPGLNSWMRTQPPLIRGQLNTLVGDVSVLCGWAETNASVRTKCPSLHKGPGGTGDVPKDGPKYP